MWLWITVAFILGWVCRPVERPEIKCKYIRRHKGSEDE